MCPTKMQPSFNIIMTHSVLNVTYQEAGPCNMIMMASMVANVKVEYVLGKYTWHRVIPDQ